jgi:hypothetical protein
MNAVKAHDLNCCLTPRHAFDALKIHYPFSAADTKVIEIITKRKKAILVRINNILKRNISRRSQRHIYTASILTKSSEKEKRR